MQSIDSKVLTKPMIWRLIKKESASDPQNKFPMNRQFAYLRWNHWETQRELWDQDVLIFDEEGTDILVQYEEQDNQ